MRLKISSSFFSIFSQTRFLAELFLTSYFQVKFIMRQSLKNTHISYRNETKASKRRNIRPYKNFGHRQ